MPGAFEGSHQRGAVADQEHYPRFSKCVAVAEIFTLNELKPWLQSNMFKKKMLALIPCRFAAVLWPRVSWKRTSSTPRIPRGRVYCIS